jgi:hypothetical protein
MILLFGFLLAMTRNQDMIEKVNPPAIALNIQLLTTAADKGYPTNEVGDALEYALYISY